VSGHKSIALKGEYGGESECSRISAYGGRIQLAKLLHPPAGRVVAGAVYVFLFSGYTFKLL